MNDCVFCKIIEGVIPSDKIYEDEKFVIFRDIDPKAEKHYLAVPKRHFKLLSEADEKDRTDLGEILYKISVLSGSLGLKGGYRLIINQGEDAGQTVFHLHIHILGGQTLDFPDLRNK